MSEYPPDRHGPDDGGAAWPVAPQVAPPPWSEQTGEIPVPRSGEQTTPVAPQPWEAAQGWGAQSWPGDPQKQWNQGQQWAPQQPPQQWAQPAQQWPQQQQWVGERQQWPPQQPPQQWAPSGPMPPMQRPPAPPKGANQGLIIGLVIGLVVLLAGGGAGWYFFLGPGKAATTDAAASSSAPVSNAAPPSAVPHSGSRVGVPSGESPGTVPGGAAAPTTASPAQLEQQAVATLNALRTDSLNRVPLDGRWVAQVASKSVGISDPLQTAQNGSHTFYAVDILAESLQDRQLVADPSKVYVLWGTDFGKRSQAADGSPYWITVVDAGYASSDNVKQWCQQAFPQLTSQQLADTCAPRQLTPPHS